MYRHTDSEMSTFDAIVAEFEEFGSLDHHSENDRFVDASDVLYPDATVVTKDPVTGFWDIIESQND